MNTLPKGVRLYKGKYVQVRIMRQGRYYLKNFGADSPLARELAGIHAAEKYKEILLGTFGITKEPKALKFKEARQVFLKRHFEDYHDPSTNAPRTQGAIKVAGWLLDSLGRYFDTYALHEINVLLVENYRVKRLNEDHVTNATFNKEKGILYSMFKQFNAWMVKGAIHAVKLPKDKDGNVYNPCSFVPHLTEKHRERIPDTRELATAYNWCQQNDIGLWDAIEKALLTALRKQDLIGLDGSLTVKGIQQKTGEKFDLPIILDKPVNLTNYRRRWNALRTAMGWLKGTEKHTTWHDLRHWAPTLLGESGFSTKIIQHYGGWAKAETAERYTNIRSKALEPAVKTIQEAIEQLKIGGSNANKS